MSNRRRVVIGAEAALCARIARILPECDVERVSNAADLAYAAEPPAPDALFLDSSFDHPAARVVLKRILLRKPAYPVVAFSAVAEFPGVSNFMEIRDFPDDEAGNGRVRRMLERLFAPAT